MISSMNIIFNCLHILVQLSSMYIIHDMYQNEILKIRSYKMMYVDLFSQLLYRIINFEIRICKTLYVDIISNLLYSSISFPYMHYIYTLL